jgi:RNA polymerase sigma-70 factor (ECF subfamily)
MSKDRVELVLTAEPDGPLTDRRHADAEEHKTLLRDMSGLKAQLTRVTRDADVAEDLLQDAIVTALRKLRSGEIEHRSQLDGYVYRVALNHFRNYRRKDKSSVSDADSAAALEDTAAEIRPTLAIQTEQWAAVVRRLLRELSSPRDREVLVRFYLKEEERGALCRSLGLTDLQFNRVIFRARERFRELLENKGFGKSDLLSLAFSLCLCVMALTFWVG